MKALAALAESARRAGLGRVLLTYYHRPAGLVQKSILEGGPWEQGRTERGRLAMMETAERLPPLETPADDRRLRVAFLSGDRYWYQTLFCFYSLQSQISQRIWPLVFDDGSFTETTRASIRRVVPWVEFVSLDDIEARLDRLLPRSLFPSLRSRRLVYPHLRKLTDVHVGNSGWRLVLDSDMIFYRRPDALLSWFNAPTSPCCMQESATAYGYSRRLMTALAGRPVPEFVNVGVCGLESGAIDWDLMEFWCRSLLEGEGPLYLQEQALTAMWLAHAPFVGLSMKDYRVKPDLAEGRHPTAVLHHYVANSKRSYFQYGWRRVAAAENELTA